MITTLADVLHALQTAEGGRLRTQGISHGPTIGAMYEGLTKDILERAIPPGLDLRVVSGFVEGIEGSLSNQVDLMLVRGEGCPIPYTDDYVWPIEDVLVVFEVKKNLNVSEFSDAVGKMRAMLNLAQTYRRSGGYADSGVSFACKIFAKLTGYNLPVSDIDLLPEPLKVIFYCMVWESLYPVRVILSYEGYRTEVGLRKAAEKVFFNGVGDVTSKGFMSLPSLVICGGLSLTKLNGFPYFNRHVDFSDTWDVMASSSDNPSKILLEQIWTKISSEANVKLPMDDTLNQERMSLLFRYKYVEDVVGGRQISGFGAESFAHLALTIDRPMPSWSPEPGSDFKAIAFLLAAKKGFVDVSDDWFKSLCVEYGVSPQDALVDFVRQRTMAWTCVDRSRAAPIEPENGIALMPDDSVVMSDNRNLMELWLKRGE